VLADYKEDTVNAQGAVRKWNAQERRLRAADKLPMLTGGLVTNLAGRTGIVGCKE
jgi:hypothetical protein